MGIGGFCFQEQVSELWTVRLYLIAFQTVLLIKVNKVMFSLLICF